ncbi:MAG: magnesium protoporphyrin IX methyltransferase [Gemmatimonadota bacterium]|nr:magnesium protoporphyrin IX methyltransferase [Gemmatimonadota bacterium]
MSGPALSAAVWSERRESVARHFDARAATWERLTFGGPVGWIRRSVQEGRTRMRVTLLDGLPQDLSGCSVLDAGCGAGLMAMDLAERGARVVAVDVSSALLRIGAEQWDARGRPGRLEFRHGDLLDLGEERFDIVVAMDSLIHYPAAAMLDAVRRLADHTTAEIRFTFAPRTPFLGVMHSVGKLFPRPSRAPGVHPQAARGVRDRLRHALPDWDVDTVGEVRSGFYVSAAARMVRAGGARAVSSRPEAHA